MSQLAAQIRELTKKNPIQSFSRYLYPLILGLNGLFIYFFSSLWTVNKSDIDVWFYNGYFKMGSGVYKQASPSIASQYFDTRLPFNLPGQLFYSFFDDSISKLIFNVIIVYGFTSTLLYFILINHVKRNIAFITVSLVATEMYFLRNVGSDYVYNGVLIYFLASALFIFKYKNTNSNLNLILSGALYCCMILSNASSVYLTILLILIYYFENQKKISKKTIYHHVSLFSFGFLLILLIFQALYVKISERFEFIFLPSILQLRISSESFGTSWTSVLMDYSWNFTLLVALSISIFSLVELLGRNIFENSNYFYLLLPIVLIQYALVSIDSLNILLSRDGLYVNSLLLPVALVFAKILDKKFSPTTFTSILILFGLNAIAILKLRNIIEIDQNTSKSYFVVSLIFTLILFLSSIGKSTTFYLLQSMSIIFVCGTFIFTNWSFDGNLNVSKFRNFVLSETRDITPYFFLDTNKNAFQNDASYIASFTQKAWWKTGLKYPNCFQLVGGSMIQPNSDLIVLSRNKIVDSEKQASFSKCLKNPKLIANTIQNDRFGNLYISVMRTSNTDLYGFWKYVGVDLPTIVGETSNNSLFASKDSAVGVLSYGPYLSLIKGNYQAIISYQTDSEGNTYDICFSENGTQRIVTSGQLNVREITQTVNFSLNKNVKGLEIRTFHSKGNLELKSLTITQLKNKQI